MSAEQIMENAVVAISGIVEIVPRKWRSVRSFHLKLLESLALPVYQAVLDETLLKIEGGKDSKKEVVKFENKDLKNEKMAKKKGRIGEVSFGILGNQLQCEYMLLEEHMAERLSNTPAKVNTSSRPCIAGTRKRRIIHSDEFKNE
ncbi:hypothetical protein M0R45_020835 [Rubus argutus]|uniref:Uncharacterized protein n=1 Tax=Rubus argutus TaxID=59490 RepID=A0AAW1XBB4_RUBAR